jgi:hypothetical protein
MAEVKLVKGGVVVLMKFVKLHKEQVTFQSLVLGFGVADLVAVG